MNGNLKFDTIFSAIRNPFGTLEFAIVYLLARFVHISYAIRYLQNPHPGVTVPLLRAFGAEIGDQTRFKRGIVLDNVYKDKNSTGDFSHLHIGDNTYIGNMAYLDLADHIHIGNNVGVSNEVTITTHTDVNPSPFFDRLFPRECAPTYIGDETWLAEGCTVFHGVDVAERTLVTANSLLKQDTDRESVYAGNPGEKVRSLRAND